MRKFSTNVNASSGKSYVHLSLIAYADRQIDSQPASQADKLETEIEIANGDRRQRQKTETTDGRTDGRPAGQRDINRRTE